MPGSIQQNTTLLVAHVAGQPSAAKELLPSLYRELRQIASRLMDGERQSHTLTPTALVHEAYVRLVEYDRLDWKDRAHFRGIAAIAMRRLLVNYAKSRRRLKRGGGKPALSITAAEDMTLPCSIDVLYLHEALKRLTALDPRRAEVVDKRYFGGMTEKEVAHVLGVSERTVQEDWRVARAWLLSELSA